MKKKKGDELLQAKIDTAIMRIVELYEETEGKCVLSFSGGKDSTVLAELYLMAKEQGKVGTIPIVFADTQVEYDAIYDFVEWFGKEKQEVVFLKPRKSFVRVLKEYGKPIISKSTSLALNTYQNVLNRGEDPLKYTLSFRIITGQQFDNEKKEARRDKNGKVMPHKARLADKHFHLLHPNNEHRYSRQCCVYLKKYPFYDYYSEHGVKGYFTGMRNEEGGARSMSFASCKQEIKLKGKMIQHVMPMFYWSDEDVNEFVKTYNIKLSDAYTKYGLKRTGCIGCPYAKDISVVLRVLYDYEPNKYKAVMKLLSDIYLEQNVQIPFDVEYTEKLVKRQKIIDKRRYEMLLKYRPEVAHKWKPKKDLFDIGDE